MNARRRPWPETHNEMVVEADVLANELRALFRELRPQIERVAKGQKRRRMPAAGYHVMDKISYLYILTGRLRKTVTEGNGLRQSPKAEASTRQPSIASPQKEGNVIPLAAAAEKLRDFKTGKLAWHHYCEASRALGPADDRIRKLHATAVRELERYGRALSKSPEMRALAEIERSSGQGWDGWHIDLIRELAELLKAKERLASKERGGDASATPSTTATKPAWDGRGAVIQFTRAERGPFAGDTQ